MAWDDPDSLTFIAIVMAAIAAIAAIVVAFSIMTEALRY